MRRILVALLLLFLGTPAGAVLVYEQAPDPAGGVLVSSWYPPDGTDYDAFVYDSFILSASVPVTEVHWRGGYQYTGYGLVTDFTITFYASTAANSQPLCGLPGDSDVFLATYQVGGTAGQTYAGVYGGTTMYDYQYALPQPFQATAGVKYWIRITGETAGLPFWGIAAGTGGNGSHFRYIRGAHQFSFGSHDAAFSLHTTEGPTYQITTSAQPPAAGTTGGDGAYPPGSQATVSAWPNAGWGFVEWTENGVPVSNAPDYTFTVNADRALVANFTTAYTVTTNAQPPLGGTTTGDGVYNAGALVTVDAAVNPGWVFVDWSEGGLTVSTSPSFSFIADADRFLDANFALGPGGVLFDFDTAPVGSSLPIDLTVDGLTAHFSATQYGYSIQRADALGFTPAGFAGYCIYPNSVFAADLLVSFAKVLTDFSIMYSPQELGCDDSATLRVTAYRNGVSVGTSTTTAAAPGTWPTGTLSISVVDGFDAVVVHYDAPPPTCQDYGMIFLADNMLVTVAPWSAADPLAPPSLALAAFPNPFAGETQLRFGVARGGALRAAIYDLAGRCLRTLLREQAAAPGERALVWDGRDRQGRQLASGVYFCRVESGGEARTARLVLLRED